MKKALKIILVLIVVLTYAAGKVYKLQRQSNFVSKALKERQANTKIVEIENTKENNIKKISDKGIIITEIKGKEE